MLSLNRQPRVIAPFLAFELYLLASARTSLSKFQAKKRSTICAKSLRAFG
jgi:hypothetical protein